jgi:hypothetical protein
LEAWQPSNSHFFSFSNAFLPEDLNHFYSLYLYTLTEPISQSVSAKKNMRKLLFSFLLICLCSISIAQIVYPYQDIKLEKPSDYKETEPMAYYPLC